MLILDTKETEKKENNPLGDPILSKSDRDKVLLRVNREANIHEENIKDKSKLVKKKSKGNQIGKKKFKKAEENRINGNKIKAKKGKKRNSRKPKRNGKSKKKSKNVKKHMKKTKKKGRGKKDKRKRTKKKKQTTKTKPVGKSARLVCGDSFINISCLQVQILLYFYSIYKLSLRMPLMLWLMRRTRCRTSTSRKQGLEIMTVLPGINCLRGGALKTLHNICFKP